MVSPNQTYQDALSQVFMNKPEMVINFPDWLLSEKQINIYRNLPRLAIVEIAGRDSVAAAVKSVQEEGFTDLLPVYAYTGTEFGEWAHVGKAVERLSRRLPDICIHPLLVMGSPRFWRALNGRFISELISKFGFYTPCLGCHLYLHAARIPLSIKLGNKPVISGERELHGELVKINQTAEALDFYLKFVADFDIRLLFPLRTIASGNEIEEILKDSWKRGKEQLGCTFSENYRMIDGQKKISPHEIRNFLEKFASPAAREILASYVSGQVPNHNGVAGRILKDITTG